MKLISAVKMSAALCCIALSLLSASAAPMYRSGSPATRSEENAATWWRDYLLTESYKEPPVFLKVHKASPTELLQHMQPFQQRLIRLNYLKQWVLTNKETRTALTKQQLETLAKPFYSWDQELRKPELAQRHQLVTKLSQEKTFVAEVESVLHDVAKYLPDVNPRA